MRNILAIIFIGFVTQASAEDVWFCQGDNLYHYTDEDRKMNSFIPQNFKFRVNEDTSKVYFGTGGYLNNVILDLLYYSYDLSGDEGILQAGNKWSNLQMWNDGNFKYATVHDTSMTVMTAKCDKF